ncbi:MAG: hypothetical protein ACT452_19880 [Microthrixaceae bacterium]
MTIWGVTAGCLMLVAGIGACSDDSASTPTSTTTHRTTTTTTAPERPTSTTTTTYAPASVEGQVEAAYLKSWDVYAEAVYDLHLDEAALAEVYAGRSLDSKRTEIRQRIAEKRAALVRVEHRYDVLILDAERAKVVDRLINHQVLIDPASKAPVEEDPNEQIVFSFELSEVDGVWRVTLIERVKL